MVAAGARVSHLGLMAIGSRGSWSPDKNGTLSYGTMDRFGSLEIRQ